jgi:hypothetical protein
LTAAEIKELAAFKATDDSRRLTLPKTPEEYEVRLPKNYQIPQGIEYTINPDDPIVPHARDFALKAGLSKDQFEQLVGLYAQAEIGRQQRYQAAAKDEILKLGPNASTRVTVVQTFLKAQLGDELARQFFFTTMGSARNVEAMEKLMSNFASQGGGSYSAAHQTAPESGDVIPGYDRMNFVQRRAAQDALAARRAGRR